MSLRRRLTEESINGELNFKFIRIFASLSSISAIVVVAYAAATLGAAGSTVNALASVATAAGMSGFTNLQAALYMILAGGLVAFIASVIGFWSAQFSSKPFLYMFIVLTVASSAVTLAGGFIGNGILSDLAFILCEEEGCNALDSDFSDAQKGLVTVGLAYFDACCVPSFVAADNLDTSFTTALSLPDHDLIGTRVQTVGMGSCPLSGAACLALIPDLIANLDGLEFLPPLLCTCAPDGQSLGLAVQSMLDDPSICAALSEATFTFDESILIPTTSFNIMTPLVLNYPDFFDLRPELQNSITVPLVGNPGPPFDDAAYPNGGLGCGLGLSKGALWYQQLYMEENLSVFFTVAIAFGVLSLLSAALAFAYISIARTDDLDLLDYKDDPYAVPPSQSKLALRSAGPAAAVPAAVVVSRPARSNAPDTKVVAKKAGEVVVSKKAVADLQKKLDAFYGIHEPSKLKDGHVDKDVVNFGINKGVAALNAKLREKYDADLDDVDDVEAGSADASSDAGSDASAGAVSSASTNANVIADGLVKKDVDDII